MNFRFLYICLIVFSVSLALFIPNVRCEADPIEDELEEDVQVELDDVPEQAQEESLMPTKEEGEQDDKPLKPSPDVETILHFVKPPKATNELPAGKDVQILVGVTNKGNQDMTIDTMDASFRYPMDFSFYIQNFSMVSYDKLIKPKEQASLYYIFYINEGFASRPFGLTINLQYRDAQGQQYLDAVYNETITIVELDEGLDGETFFLYILMGAVAILVSVGGHQLFQSMMKKKPQSKPKMEMGTQNHNDVDYDWLPKETLTNMNKSPKMRQSPRQKKQGRNKEE